MRLRISHYRIIITLLVVLLLATGCGQSKQDVTSDSNAVVQADVIDPPTEAPAEPTSEPEPTDEPDPTATPEPEPATEPEPTEEPTAEPAEESAAEVESTEPEQPASPLAQPSSPLNTPDQFFSPLALPTITAIEADVTPDMSYIQGQLMSNVTGQPLPNTVVRFPEILCPENAEESSEPTDATSANETSDGCFWTLSDGFTVGAVSAEDGTFLIPEIEASDYLILVGDLMTVYAFAMIDADEAYQFTAPANEDVDLGKTYFDYE